MADYVIAGSGSAGAVLAARLTENPDVKVILIEAGKDRSRNLFVTMPAGSYAMMGNKIFDWSILAEPDPSIGGRRINWSGGKMLGGSSSINGMVYVRGNRDDYTRWVEAGADGWGWPEMLPYFLKAENYQGAPSQWHGSHGPLKVGHQNARHELVDAVIGAFVNNGVPHREEYCDGDQYGVYKNLTTAPGGRRSSTAVTYLAEARKRPNLTIMTETTVDKVLISEGRATGLRVIRGGVASDIMASTTLVCAGALNSPAILMRSGIGPAQALSALGIPVVADLPVGQNLQDHCGLTYSKLVDVPTYNSPFGPWTIGKNLLRWLAKKDGPMSSAAVQVMAGLRSSPELPEADIAVSFIPLAIGFEKGKPQMHKQPGITIGGNCMRPDSRGEIRLASSDPHAAPIIDHRLLGDERDVRRLIAFGKFLDRLFRTEPLASHVVADNFPTETPRDDAEWEALIRATSGIGYHAAGTCRMGGADAVLDPQLRVRGIEGLRVVDASVMPSLVSGNTNAATIAIAERAAELLSQVRR